MSESTLSTGVMDPPSLPPPSLVRLDLDAARDAVGRAGRELAARGQELRALTRRAQAGEISHEEPVRALRAYQLAADRACAAQHRLRRLRSSE